MQFITDQSPQIRNGLISSTLVPFLSGSCASLKRFPPNPNLQYIWTKKGIIFSFNKVQIRKHWRIKFNLSFMLGGYKPLKILCNLGSLYYHLFNFFIAVKLKKPKQIRYEFLSHFNP